MVCGFQFEKFNFARFQLDSFIRVGIPEIGKIFLPVVVICIKLEAWMLNNSY